MQHDPQDNSESLVLINVFITPLALAKPSHQIESYENGSNISSQVNCM